MRRDLLLGLLTKKLATTKTRVKSMEICGIGLNLLTRRCFSLIRWTAYCNQVGILSKSGAKLIQDAFLTRSALTEKRE